jgi:hypothetical protein
MYIVDLLAIRFVDCAHHRKVALDPSGKSRAHRHHREDYTARARQWQRAFLLVRRKLRMRFCFAETCSPHFNQI